MSREKELELIELPEGDTGILNRPVFPSPLPPFPFPSLSADADAAPPDSLQSSKTVSRRLCGRDVAPVPGLDPPPPSPDTKSPLVLGRLVPKTNDAEEVEEDGG